MKSTESSLLTNIALEQARLEIEIGAMHRAASEKPGGGGRNLDFHTVGEGGNSAQEERLRAVEEEGRSLQNAYRREHEDLQREYDLQLTSLQSFTERAIAEEDNYYAQRVENLARQKALAHKQSEIQKILNEIEEAGREHDRNTQKLRDEEAQRELEALKAHREAVLKLDDDYDARSIASIRASVEMRAATEEEGEQKILDIQIAAMNRRRDAIADDQRAMLEAAGFLFDAENNAIAGTGDMAKVNAERFEQLVDQFNQLTSQLETLQEEGERRVNAARARDEQAEREYQNRMQALHRETEQQRRDNERAELEARERHVTDHITILARQTELDLEEADERSRRNLEELQKRQTEEESLTNSEERKLEIEQNYHELRNQEMQRWLDERDEIMRQGNEAAERQDPSSARSLFGDDIADKMDGATSSWQRFGTVVTGVIRNVTQSGQNMGQILGGAFGSIAQGIGSMVHNWVLYGTTGPAAIRKVLAEALASKAAEAAVNALWYTALGIADTFWNPARAGADFAAAEMFAIIAGGSALAGRALAGNAFRNDAARDQGLPSAANSGSSGGNSGNDSNGTQIIEKERREVVVVVRHFRLPKSYPKLHH
ncbi:MAG: hypothetical protein AUG51_19370 [Acidobacteria bacterium 13_1_20CM_3_53_8]|nr:MAG: hypothetical protein AUG51_19370 [Acidobacteria bacterium 13_1_20CM_3_53_8]